MACSKNSRLMWLHWDREWQEIKHMAFKTRREGEMCVGMLWVSSPVPWGLPQSRVPPAALCRHRSAGKAKDLSASFACSTFPKATISLNFVINQGIRLSIDTGARSLKIRPYFLSFIHHTWKTRSYDWNILRPRHQKTERCKAEILLCSCQTISRGRCDGESQTFPPLAPAFPSPTDFPVEF